MFLANLGRIALRDRGLMWSNVIARSVCDEAIHSFFTRLDGLLRFNGCAFARPVGSQ
jgi:hypothetical protein